MRNQNTPTWLNTYHQIKQQQQQQPTSTTPSPNDPSSTSLSPHLQILRVNQLDAQRLDYEITIGLNSYFKRMFQFFDPSFIERYQPELQALLQFCIYRFSIMENDQSFGDRIQNVKYVCSATGHKVSRQKKWAHAFLSIGLPYLFQRLNRITVDYNWGGEMHNVYNNQADTNNDEISSQRSRLKLMVSKLKYFTWKHMQTAEMFYKLLSLVNFVLFLNRGKYRSIVDRLCGMRLVYSSKLMNRQVSFDYMNRELVWNGFAEMILFLIPLIQFQKWKHLWSRLLYRYSRANKGTKSSVASHDVHKQQQQEQAKQQKQQVLKRWKDNSRDVACTVLGNTVCPLCKLDPIQVPYVCDPCGHVFCYYCIYRNVGDMESAYCPECNTPITHCKRAAGTSSANVFDAS